jgi:hypothetical protein
MGTKPSSMYQPSPHGASSYEFKTILFANIPGRASYVPLLACLKIFLGCHTFQ